MALVPIEVDAGWGNLRKPPADPGLTRRVVEDNCARQGLPSPVFAHFGGAFPMDVISGIVPTLAVGSYAGAVVNPSGLATDMDGSSVLYYGRTAADDIAGPFTVFSSAMYRTNATNNAIFSSGENTAGNGFMVSFDDVVSLANSIYTLVKTTPKSSVSNLLGLNSEGRYHDILISMDGTNAYFMADGTISAPSAFTALPAAHASRVTRVGARRDGSYKMNGVQDVVLVWDRALTADQYRMLRSNWPALSAPAPRTLFVDMGGGITKTIADSGAGSDTLGSILAALALSDTGSGLEGLVGAASVPVVDIGQGTDAALFSASVSLSDFGTYSDVIPGISATLVIPDSGIGNDSLISLLAALSITDTTNGSDTLSLASALAVSDVGSGNDFLSVLTSVLVSLSESGIGSDMFSISVDSRVLDSGTGQETPVIAVAFAMTDAGVGSDVAMIALLKSIADAAMGTDSIGPVSVVVPISDAGVGLDAIGAIRAALSIADQFQGLDLIIRTSQSNPQRVILTFAARAPRVMFATRKPTVTFH